MQKALSKTLFLCYMSGDVLVVPPGVNMFHYITGVKSVLKTKIELIR